MVDLVDLVPKNVEAYLHSIFTQNHSADLPSGYIWKHPDSVPVCLPETHLSGLKSQSPDTGSLIVMFLICALLTPSGCS